MVAGDQRFRATAPMGFLLAQISLCLVAVRATASNVTADPVKATAMHIAGN